MLLCLQGKSELPGIMSNTLLLYQLEGYLLNGVESYWPLQLTRRRGAFPEQNRRYREAGERREQ